MVLILEMLIGKWKRPYLNDCQSCEEIALVLEEICKNTEFGDKALEKI